MPILYNIDQGNDDTYLYNLKLDSNHRVIVTNKFIKYFDIWNFEYPIEPTDTPVITGVLGCFRSAEGSQDEYFYIARSDTNQLFIIMNSMNAVLFNEHESMESINQWFSDRFENYEPIENQFEIDGDTINYVSENTTAYLYQIAFTPGFCTLPEYVDTIIVNNVETPEIMYPSELKTVKIMNKKTKLNDYIYSMNLGFSLESVYIANCEATEVATLQCFCYAREIVFADNSIVASKMNSFTGIDFNNYFIYFENLERFRMDSFTFTDTNLIIWLIANSPNLQKIEMNNYSRSLYNKFLNSENISDYIIYDDNKEIIWVDTNDHNYHEYKVKAPIMMNYQYDIMYY